jgi:Rieske Fe-S protein
MKRGIIIIGVLVLLGSCASTGPGPAVDWAALESSSNHTEAMEFLPEIEIANLRISAFRMGSSAVDRAPDVMVLRSPRMEPLGVYLGNGLAIDSDGSVFFDILKLLKIDTSQRFNVICKADDRSGTITMTNDGTAMTLVAPRGRGTFEESDGGLALNPATGKAIMKTTSGSGLYTYRSTIALDPSSEMRADKDQITVKSGIRIDSGVVIEWQGNSIVFNSRSNTTWPRYVVTKKGDTYIINYKSDTARVDFKIYYAGSSVYVVRNGFSLCTVTISDSSVLVNGKEMVTYSRG